MTSEIDEIREILEARPDTEFLTKKSRVQFERMGRDEVYIHGDEDISDEGTYIHIYSEIMDIYIAKEMIERIMNYLGGDDHGDGLMRGI